MKKNQLTTTRSTDIILGRSKSLLKITKKILSNTSSNALVDESWMENLWEWADENEIDEEILPRDKETLCEMTKLEIMYYKISTLPPEIGNLTNLKVLSLLDTEIVTLPPEIAEFIVILLIFVVVTISVVKSSVVNVFSEP